MTIEEVKKLLEWESERAERRGQERQRGAELIREFIRYQRIKKEKKNGKSKSK